MLAALRLGDSAEETDEVTRLLAYATEAIEQHAPDASETAMNEAARRLAGHLFDQPEAARGDGDGYANAMRNSGAARMLLPYRIHRAGYADAVSEAQAAVGTTGNPVTALDIVGGELVVTFADGTSESHTLPAGMGGDGTDQTARDAAASAQTAADDAQGEIDNHETSEHNTDQTARDAAGVAQGRADNAFTAAATAQGAADTAQTDIDEHEAQHPGGGDDAGNPVTLHAFANVGSGWREIDLTQSITTGFLVEFRIADVGAGAVRMR